MRLVVVTSRVECQQSEASLILEHVRVLRRLRALFPFAEMLFENRGDCAERGTVSTLLIAPLSSNWSTNFGM